MQYKTTERTDKITVHSTSENLDDHEFFVGSYNGWLVAVQAIEITYITYFEPTWHDGPVYHARLELKGTKVNKGRKLGQQTLTAAVYASSADRSRKGMPTWAINLLVSHRPDWWNGDLGGMLTRIGLEVHEAEGVKTFVWMKP